MFILTFLHALINKHKQSEKCEAHYSKNEVFFCYISEDNLKKCF
jgi:hypothetical protein